MHPAIQFHCPACGGQLVVPPSAAGARGPCPRCGVEIIGPEPARRLPARRVSPPVTGAAPRPPEVDLSAPVELLDELEPFSDFVPPPEPAGDLLGRRGGGRGVAGESDGGVVRAGVSPAVLVLSCLVVGMAAFAGGFLTGRSGFDPLAALRRTEEPAAGPAPGTSGAAPARPWLPPTGPAAAPANPSPPATGPNTQPSGPAPAEDDPQPPPVPTLPTPPTPPPDSGDPPPTAPPPAAAAPEAALQAFLSAPGWAARTAHVLHPEQVREAMARHAAEHGDGPIATTGVSLLQTHDDAHIFLVRTTRLPAGFPVAVAETKDGCLVDWETFIEFHDDRFQAFAEGPVGASGVFHLMVNRDESAAKDPAVACFRLNPPVPGREQVARVKRDSPAGQKLDRVFEEQRNFDQDTFERLVASNGLPLVLAVAKREPLDGQPSLEIEDVIAVGWGPVQE